MHIYKITNAVDGKFYVGQTINGIHYRLRKHKELALRGGGYKLGAAIRSHGAENFTTEVLEVCESREHLNEREAHYISTLKPHYNLCWGPQFHLSPESIAKMANSLRGKKHSEETKAKRNASIKNFYKNNPDVLKKRGEAISKSKIKPVEVKGVVYNGIAELAEAYGVSYATAQQRLKKGGPWRHGVRIGRDEKGRFV